MTTINIKKLLKEMSVCELQRRNEIMGDFKSLKDKEAAVSELFLYLNDTDNALRWASAKIIGVIGPAWITSIDPLLEKLTDPDENVRISVIEALGELRDIRAISDLINSIQLEQDSGVRCVIIKSLSQMADSAAERVLVDCLNDGSSNVKLATVRALSLSNNKEIIANLQKLLKDSDRSVRWAALQAIEDIKK